MLWSDPGEWLPRASPPGEAALAPGDARVAIAGMLMQCVHIVCAMRREGYIHCDLREDNVMVRRTDAKYVIVGGARVPTYGYRCVCIDYSEIVNLEYVLPGLPECQVGCDLATVFCTFLRKASVRKVRSIAPQNQTGGFSGGNPRIPPRRAAELTALLRGRGLDAPVARCREVRARVMGVLYQLLYFEEYRAGLADPTSVQYFEVLPRETIIFFAQNLFSPEAVKMRLQTH
jgi:hypothetical protein